MLITRHFNISYLQ